MIILFYLQNITVRKKKQRDISYMKHTENLDQYNLIPMKELFPAVETIPNNKTNDYPPNYKTNDYPITDFHSKNVEFIKQNVKPK